jgi:hypothetical protein
MTSGPLPPVIEKPRHLIPSIKKPRHLIPSHCLAYPAPRISDIFVNHNNKENDKEWPQFTITEMVNIC